MVVNCLSDGVQVDIRLGDAVGPTGRGWDGVLYVKGYSDREECRRVITSRDQIQTIDFKIDFNSCGLIHAQVWRLSPFRQALNEFASVN